MSQFPNNSPLADFLCRSCNEEFELKSQKSKIIGLLYSDVDNPFFSTMTRIIDSELRQIWDSGPDRGAELRKWVARLQRALA